MRRIIFFLWLLAPAALLSQELVRFRMVPQKGTGVTTVSLPLGGYVLNTDSFRISLFEISGNKVTEIPCQLETGTDTRLWFISDFSKGEKRYIVRKTSLPETFRGNLGLMTDEKATVIKKQGAPILSYNHSEVLPPEGVDMKYKRSGFIHPLWSPGGEVLTRIQAPDHYHHYGIWNPWTKTTIDGREVDFWNLMKGEGTVRFAGYLDAVAGEVFAGFKVHQEHVFFIDKGKEQLAMNEVWDVRVWDFPGKKVSVVDLTTTLNTPLQGGIVLDAYRYGGGIGFRATEKWHKDNSTVLTSEGKARQDADGTNARWCIVEGASMVPEGRSGILFLSHPSNRMHPEPMRVWPPDINNGRGDLYFEFCPIRNIGWKLEPLKNYTLKYRMVVFDGKMPVAEAERFWKGFAVAPKMVMIEQ